MTTPDSSPFVRAFIAVELPPDVREKLAAAQTRLQKAQGHVSWVPPENLHLSLAFLGDIGPETAEWIAAALDDIAAATLPFSFDVVGLGTFGGPLSPRVIWAGVTFADPVNLLQSRVTDALRSLNIPLESREFRPHITLGRVRSPRGRDDLLRAVAAAADLPFGRAPITRVLLMKSVLRPSGAQYAILHPAPFRNP